MKRRIPSAFVDLPDALWIAFFLAVELITAAGVIYAIAKLAGA